ncbi:MAG: helix-turn-helix domain-containing protein [Microthrixaceae bacterium]
MARRSGVAKTTLYRHFGTTEALVFAVVQQNVAAVDPPDTGTLKDLAEIHRALSTGGSSATEPRTLRVDGGPRHRIR